MPDWSWAAASRRGTSHERRGEPRQDAYRMVVSGGDVDLIAAVACDGAGSAPRGGAGAAIAVRVLSSCAAAWVEEAGRLPHPDALACWILLARRRIQDAARSRDLDPSEFATTAVMTMTDGSTSITAHVGDGTSLARDASTGMWIPLSWPEHGEYASTTRFLTDADGLSLRIAVHRGAIDRLAVMTDGLERLALDFHAMQPHVGFLDPMSAPLAARAVGGRDAALSLALGSYLASDRVNDRTDDDKTLILAARR